MQLFLLPCTSQTSDAKRCISCRPRSQSFFKSLLVSWIFSMLAHTSNLFLSSSSVARSSFSSLDFKPSLTCCPQNSFQTTRGHNAEAHSHLIINILPRSRCKGFIRAFSALSSAVMLKLFPYAEAILGEPRNLSNFMRNRV